MEHTSEHTEATTTRRPTVRDLRLKRRWSQAKLALRAGVGRGVVIRAERGAPIRPLQQEAIADALGVDRLELFTEGVA